MSIKYNLIYIYCLLTTSGALDLVRNNLNTQNDKESNWECGQVDVNGWDPQSRAPWIVWYYFGEGTPPERKAAVIVDQYTLVGDGNALLSLSRNESKYQIFNNYRVVIEYDNIYGQPSEDNILEVSHVKPYGRFNRSPNWPERLYDLAVIHLKSPINTTHGSHRPICLPTNQKEIEELTQEGSRILLGGWPRDMALDYLNCSIRSEQSCKDFWAISGLLPDAYLNRVCGEPTNTDKKDCINKDGGVAIKRNGQYYLTGFTNNFYTRTSDLKCNTDSRYIFSVLQEEMLDWVRANIKNGPNKFTCDNGEGIDLGGVCNQKPDCEDASDEDVHYCRGLNYCNPNQFACGVYGRCIDLNLVCNGVEDCELGEDEVECLPKPKSMLHIGLGVGGSLILLSTIFTGLFIYLWRKYKETGYLSKEEIEEFRMGKKGSVSEGSIEAMPYNEDYEIELDFLKFNLSEELGSGQFGIVYKGTYDKKGYERSVAVKTIKNQGDLDLLKELLLEIKIMIHVGSNENIVNFIGACTKNIKSRSLFVVLEYCALGSLEDYLRKYKCTYMKSVVQNSSYVKLRSRPEYTFSDLVNWSQQIADGMSHLSNKKIVHGDLATRNVLLDSSRVAKISDFGLSLKLYEKDYAKDNKRMVPWRWMSLESLTDFKFSTQSDIWSFGVTMWEIFSLSNVPFSGRNYDESFLLDLVNGLRLGKPEEASNEIFQIMQSCWAEDPNSRPSFQCISRNISNTQKSPINYVSLNSI